MTLPLFEIGPADALPSRPPAGREARRRERQAVCLTHGLHPLTDAVGFPIRLHPEAAPAGDRGATGRRCGSCRYRQDSPYRHARTYWKCAVNNYSRATNGPATDLRAWWPACVDYQQKESSDAP